MTSHYAYNNAGLEPSELDPSLEERWAALLGILQGYSGLIVALSGGVDSTLLAAAAVEALGRAKVICATAVSPSFPKEDLAVCESFAAGLGAEFIVVSTQEFTNERYLENDLMRCYFCKSALMDELEPLGKLKERTVTLGVNMDDLADHRPGQTAARERGAVFPFVEAGVGKAEIRGLARWLGLAVWDRPQAACLSSRIPFGTPVTIEALSMVERGEVLLRRLGIRQVRLRHHGDVARIEVPFEEFPVVLSQTEEITRRLKRLGYKFVSLDLEGFTSGSMHKALQVRSK